MEVTTQIQLRYSDTDQMGVIYHANYVTFFEQGRTDFFKQIGIDYNEIEASGIIFPVHDIDITYHNASRLDETLYVVTTIKKISPVKIVFTHIIKTDNQIKAKGSSVIVCVDKATFKLRKLSKTLPKVYERMTDYGV
ncbi:MAG: thioesterase family protein [Candidatus Izemoplasma sp.]|nr:thioesterase family protein [Candidatus Izemoplasma sp.]